MVLPMCDPVVTPPVCLGGALGRPREADQLCPFCHSTNARARVKPQLGRLVAFGWEPRQPRHTGGVTTGWHIGRTTTRKVMQNEKLALLLVCFSKLSYNIPYHLWHLLSWNIAVRTGANHSTNMDIHRASTCLYKIQNQAWQTSKTASTK